MVGQIVADPDSNLSSHIEETIRSIADFHAQHHSEATRLRRWVERAVRLVGRPRSIGVLSVFILTWIAINLAPLAIGQKGFDPPPFQILQDIGEFVALYITVLILIAQQREKKISEHLEHLTPELAILTEKKTAKIIQLQDHPADRRTAPGQPACRGPARRRRRRTGRAGGHPRHTGRAERDPAGGAGRGRRRGRTGKRRGIATQV
jgi:uncharacterized membrane protein